MSLHHHQNWGIQIRNCEKVKIAGCKLTIARKKVEIVRIKREKNLNYELFFFLANIFYFYLRVYTLQFWLFSRYCKFISGNSEFYSAFFFFLRVFSRKKKSELCVSVAITFLFEKSLRIFLTVIYSHIFIVMRKVVFANPRYSRWRISLHSHYCNGSSYYITVKSSVMQSDLYLNPLLSWCINALNNAILLETTNSCYRNYHHDAKLFTRS